LQREEGDEELYRLLRELDEEYQKKLDALKQEVARLEAELRREREMAVKDEYRLPFLDSEIRGILEGKLDINKQAANMVLSMAEQAGTILNAAKMMRKPRVPWGLIGVAAVLAAVMVPIAFMLSIPQNFQMLVMWMSAPTNQLFVAVVAVVSLVVAILVVRRRRAAA
jgi:hypothetical protein